MERELKVRSTPGEIQEFFDIDEVLNIRYFELLGRGIYKVRIRMAECNVTFKGMLSLPKIKEKVIKACSEHYRIKSKVTLSNGESRVIYSCNSYWENEYAERYAKYKKSEVKRIIREE